MDIKASTSTLEEIFYGLKKRYFIPKYQRDYSWTANDELLELWNDVIHSFVESKEYFMGTLLLASKEKNSSHYDIVDGQQRAISFMLLLSVIQDYAKLVVDGKLTINDLDCINSDRLEVADSLYSSVSRHIKQDDFYLKANNKDSKHFEKMLNVSKRELFTHFSKKDNRIIKAKRFFQDKISKQFFGRSNSLIELQSFFRFVITNLKFVTIYVEDDFDAYVIFESLNSKGMDLSVADLLKNKILSNMKVSNQDDALVDWDDLVKTVQNASANFVDFIKIYWNAYESVDVTKSTLYQAIRKKIGNNEIKTQELLSNLVNNAESFDRLRNKNRLNWPKINTHEKWASNVAEMNLLGYTIHLPTFLYALHNNEKILPQLSKLSLNLLFGWVTICDYGVGEIDSLFKKVLADMQCGKGDDEILSNFFPLIEKVKSPFKECFLAFDSESSVILKYIICKVELYQGGKASIPDFNEVDLEHIFPKNLSRWENIGDTSHFSKPYSRWINSVGNVLLLEKGKNRKIKDICFSDKIEVYKTSAFSHTLEVSQVFHWGENNVRQRAKDLSDLAEVIWGFE